jgi:hypothetical protein
MQADSAAAADTPPEGGDDVGAGAHTPPATSKDQYTDGGNAQTALPASSRDDAADLPPPPRSSQSRVLTPPTSEDMGKCGESSSDLSELDMDMGKEDEDEDIGDVEPDHYWDDGRIPIFKPVSGPRRSDARLQLEAGRWLSAHSRR